MVSGRRDLHYLRSLAKAYALEAIACESRGDGDMAITNYNVAAESLDKYMRCYPSKRDVEYIECICSYKYRIRVLRESRFDSVIDIGAACRKYDSRLDYLVREEKPSIGICDVAGIDGSQKYALRTSIVYPSRHPDLFSREPYRTVLLCGPPGGAKTLLATATAGEIGGHIIKADAESIMTKLPGAVENSVSGLFDMALERAKEEGKPVILFVDNVDTLQVLHSEDIHWNPRAMLQFLSCVDAITINHRDAGVYVMGATSRPWHLDLPFLERFPTRIYVEQPTLEVIREHLRQNANLEKHAVKCAAEAIRCDANGSRDLAILNYRRAIDALSSLICAHPEHRINSLYKDRIVTYRERLGKLHSCDTQPSGGWGGQYACERYVAPGSDTP